MFMAHSFGNCCKDPTPSQNWTDVMNCTADRSACMQSVSIALLGPGPANISEDCLFINVYSPEASTLQNLV